MKVKIKIEKEVEVKYLAVTAGVRYWEDATVNGIEDTDGTLIPCRDGDDWKPTIVIDTGKIIGWPAGTTAEIHYKVCDDGCYALLNDEKETVHELSGYVPRVMCPQANGDGDYIIMKVRADGIIENWMPTQRNIEELLNAED